MIKPRSLGRALGYALPLLLFAGAWEVAVARSDRMQFLFASPSLVIRQLVEDLGNGVLFEHTAITGLEALLGLVLGSVVGSTLGLGLWMTQSVARISRPYVLALGSVPVFAIAPMTVIWFGTGLFAKVMLAALATITVAVLQAYEGARNVDVELVRLMRSYGATRLQTFSKVVVPGTLVWVMVSCKLNVGFAVLGAFIGEFISSSKGLGHYILRASGLYNVPQVLAGVLCIVGLSLGLAGGVSLIERRILRWRRLSDDYA